MGGTIATFAWKYQGNLYENLRYPVARPRFEVSIFGIRVSSVTAIPTCTAGAPAVGLGTVPTDRARFLTPPAVVVRIDNSQHKRARRTFVEPVTNLQAPRY
jgi:hypothetical protein